MTKEVLNDWVRKAEQDYRSALRESKVKRSPSHDVVCTLSQQTAEKYLKAFLISHKQKYPFTHSLPDLVNSCIAIDPSFEFIRQECAFLSGMFQLRYPADFATGDDSRLAVDAMKIIRKFIRTKISL